MKIITGNLLDMAEDCHFHIIVHGCNMQGVMGAGIALQIKQRFHEAYDVYIADRPNYKLGGFSIADIKRQETEFKIVNLYIQEWYGRSKSPNDSNKARYNAIETGLKNLDNMFHGLNIGLPQIGCGLCGLSWDMVEKIIAKTITNNIPNVILYG